MPEIRLQNDAAARVGTARVRCGDIRERTPDDSGARQGGLSARLILPDGDEVTVWLRSRVEIGGRAWFVTDLSTEGVTLFAPDEAPDAPSPRRRPTPPRLIEGVDWSRVGFASLVARAARGLEVTRLQRDDRSPVDGLIRAWQQLGASPELRDGLSDAIGHHARSGDLGAITLALRFFSSCPTASGGDVFADLALAGTGREAPDPWSERGGTLYGALVHAACVWRYGGETPPAVVEAACAEALSGANRDVLLALVDLAPDWFETHTDRLLALYPGGVGAIWKSLVAHGMAPLAAVDRVLPHADDHGRRSLRIVIQYRRSLDAPARSALLARLG